MKLRNKKTGEIKDVVYPGRFVLNDGSSIKTYDSLAELNAEWCDVEDDDES